MKRSLKEMLFGTFTNNSLYTPKEQAIIDISDRLISWPRYEDREEILSAVLSRVFPQAVHIHRNPKKKEAV